LDVRDIPLPGSPLSACDVDKLYYITYIVCVSEVTTNRKIVVFNSQLCPTSTIVDNRC